MTPISLSAPWITSTEMILTAKFYPVGSSSVIREFVQRFESPTLIIEMQNGARVRIEGEDALWDVMTLDEAGFPVDRLPFL